MKSYTLLMLRRSAVATVNSRRVHSYTHLAAKSHLKVWMLIVPTCNSLLVVSAARGIPQKAAQAVVGAHCLL